MPCFGVKPECRVAVSWSMILGSMKYDMLS